MSQPEASSSKGPSVDLATPKDFLCYNVSISERMIDGEKRSTIMSMYTFESDSSSDLLERLAVPTPKRTDVSCTTYGFLSVSSINQSSQWTRDPLVKGIVTRQTCHYTL